jgi:hypothetical protein
VKLEKFHELFQVLRICAEIIWLNTAHFIIKGGAIDTKSSI